ncbi:hypothetical protein C1H46_031343 [Malus baccata]|uniref:Uncharacterized protein n=1 Tax=Malus baccata TaxID=106549 RepID=A0A540LA21_MALBA|nr:hypothetical protein C1H46_031343 [Malus baccata]
MQISFFFVRFKDGDAAISPRFISSASESHMGLMGEITAGHGDPLHSKTVVFEQESKNSGEIEPRSGGCGSAEPAGQQRRAWVGPSRPGSGGGR